MLIKIQNHLSNFNKGITKTSVVPYSHSALVSLNKMLSFVTNIPQNRQLSFLTCFIIHVGLECIGENAYA